MQIPGASRHDGYVQRRGRSQRMPRASIGVAVLLKPNVELEPCTTSQRHAETRRARRVPRRMPRVEAARSRGCFSASV